jgi:hypothetical protein
MDEGRETVDGLIFGLWPRAAGVQQLRTPKIELHRRAVFGDARGAVGFRGQAV